MSDLPAAMAKTASLAGSAPDFRRRLLAWYGAARRDLPWRRDRDPYRVWISEVMLQQTRVRTARGYFERWMERFPTLDDLAAAREGDVLRAWQGLGYYARARNLHRAAIIVRDQFGSRLPRDAAALEELPGVGEYTAGAIASIAYGRPEPAVDGNARRLLCRLYDLQAPSARELGRCSAELIDHERPGDFNQALMELGASVCTPRAPRCPSCPVSGFCLAHARGTEATRPAPSPRSPVPRFRVGTAVIRSPSGRLLLARRPVPGLLAGMWEFPGRVARPGESPLSAARRALGAAAGHGSGGAHRPPTAPRLITRIQHAYSHRRHEYHAFLFLLPMRAAAHELAAGAPWTRTAWVAADGLGRFPISAAQRRIAAAAGMPPPRP